MGKQTHKGLAVLVGAGPGEASFITAAGMRWLSIADCVVYDRLANPALLDLAPPAAQRIYVGKLVGEESATQEQINDILVEQCRAGRLVVRLKGGDPFIFGRGGEEAEALAAAKLPFRVVPGVTAAIAAGACAGIPLTDRRLASSVVFVTGHEDPAKGASALNWQALAGIDTVVFYMGMKNLPDIVGRLAAAGRDGQTPVAVVERAGTPRQRTVVGTLQTIVQNVAEAGLRPPAIIIVGPVVALRARLAWMDKLPLFGRCVLVTRARRQASRLGLQLADLGAEVIEAPTIDIQPPKDPQALDHALRRLGEFDWLVLTSPNGAEALMARLAALDMDARALAGLKIAAVGPATAKALAERSIRADLLPPVYTTERLAEALATGGLVTGKRVLLARADIATDVLPQRLAEAGAKVRQLHLYRTGRPAELPKPALDALRDGRVDWITFTSSSTVDNFLALVRAAGGAEIDLSRIKLAAIGPVTAQALAGHGLAPAVTARDHTIDGLVQAMVEAG